LDSDGGDNGTGWVQRINGLRLADHNIGRVLATACIIGYRLHASWFDKLTMRTFILSHSKDEASVGHPRNV